MIRLLFWLFWLYVLFSLVVAVVTVVVTVAAIVLLAKLVVWALRAWQRHRLAARMARAYVLPTSAPRPLPSADDLLRAEVARIIEFRGEGRFIREMDERLGNPPDPAFLERP